MLDIVINLENLYNDQGKLAKAVAMYGKQGLAEENSLGCEHTLIRHQIRSII